MSVAYFIARKILKEGEEKRKISRPVVRISILSIILSVVVMILTLAIVKGFQQEVRQKIIGFGSHIQIIGGGGNSIIESQPMQIDTALSGLLHRLKGLQAIQPIAYKTAIFQSGKDTVSYAGGKERIQQEIKGMLVKGVSANFNWQFFQSCLTEGRVPNYLGEMSKEILISKVLAQQLHFKLNDEISVFFVQNKPIKRKFKVVGIFESGLEEFDDDIVIADIRSVQKYSAWGIETSLNIEDSLSHGNVVLAASSLGGNGNYKYNWGKGFGTINRLIFNTFDDTTLRVVSSDYFSNPFEMEKNSSRPDTAYIRFKVSPLKTQSTSSFKKTYLNSDGTHFSFPYNNQLVDVCITNGKGSSSDYISGYELILNDWKDFKKIAQLTQNEVFMWSMEHEKQVEVRNITQIYGSIFSWLAFLDINFYIVVCMMVLISIITMGAALLVLILEKTSAIGVLKSIGANNWLIRKVFLIQAAHLILRGLFWGNLIGISLCLLQQYGRIIPLDPAVYYLNAIPIQLDWVQLLLLNAGTLFVCVFALIVPSYFITRISPVKAMKVT